MIGAIDIGGTKIAVGIIDSEGQVIGKREYSTLPVQAPADATQKMAQVLQELCNSTQTHLEGIGVGLTGPVNPKTGVIGKSELLKKWNGFNMVAGLENIFDLPVAIENDADAAALSEAWWGSGKGSSRFIYLTISTGIGGGIILDGKLYRGVDNAHPEMGHHVIDPNGPECFCGARGCWESLASGPAMARWFRQNATSGCLLPDPVDAAMICDLAKQGDELACRAVEREAFYLGTGLANLVGIFTPEIIALGGGVMKSWPLFSSRVQEIIRQNCGLVPYSKTRVIRTSLGIDAGLIGAACTWLQHSGSGNLII